jgi:hypothetical protein
MSVREWASNMEVNAVLCNYAEVQNNLLYLTGGGIDRTVVQPGSAGPWVTSVAIGLTITVPWTQTNQQHTLTIALVDSDEHPVSVPTGPDTSEPFHGEMHFNIGRPPMLLIGEEQIVSLAITLPGLPMPELGRYSFVISVDGTELRRLSYRIMTPPGLTVPPPSRHEPRTPSR